MNDKRFDDVIKDKLEQHIPPGDSDVWSSFESKLDTHQTQQQESAFDDNVKKHLLSHRPPYNSEHWRLMKTEITTIEERKNTVFITKILELAAIFLIVFTITQLPFINKTEDIKVVELYAAQKETSKEMVLVKENAVSVTELQKIATKPIIPSILKKDISSYEIGNISEDKVIQASLYVSELNSTTSESKKISFTDIVPDVAKTSETATHLTVSDPQSVSGPTKQNIYPSLQSDLIPSGMTEVAENELMTTPIAEDKGLQSRDELEFNPIAEREFLMPESEMAVIIPINRTSVAKKPNLGLSFWAAQDVNLINTPFDKLYSLASYKKEALSDSYGVNISRQYGLLEIQTGLGYMYKEYQPKKVIDAYGEFGENYFEKSLNRIAYDLATIPFNIKYHGIHGKGWSAYLMAGAALNIIVNADYDIVETLVRGKPSAGRYLPDVARLDKKPFITGIFNGDNFKNNYYATIGFGFGIEKSIFRQTSLYIQPSYFRHVLSNDIGIGPNKDKIHTSSLQVGIKTLIN